MQKKTIVTGEAEAGHVPAQAGPTRQELDAADQRDLDAFQSVSRTSRRAVAETIRRLVRPA